MKKERTQNHEAGGDVLMTPKSISKSQQGIRKTICLYQQLTKGGNNGRPDIAGE